MTTPIHTRAIARCPFLILLLLPAATAPRRAAGAVPLGRHLGHCAHGRQQRSGDNPRGRAARRRTAGRSESAARCYTYSAPPAEPLKPLLVAPPPPPPPPGAASRPPRPPVYGAEDMTLREIVHITIGGPPCACSSLMNSGPTR